MNCYVPQKKEKNAVYIFCLFNHSNLVNVFKQDTLKTILELFHEISQKYDKQWWAFLVRGKIYKSAFEIYSYGNTRHIVLYLCLDILSCYCSTFQYMKTTSINNFCTFMWLQLVSEMTVILSNIQYRIITIFFFTSELYLHEKQIRYFYS